MEGCKCQVLEKTCGLHLETSFYKRVQRDDGQLRQAVQRQSPEDRYQQWACGGPLLVNSSTETKTRSDPLYVSHAWPVILHCGRFADNPPQRGFILERTTNLSVHFCSMSKRRLCHLSLTANLTNSLLVSAQQVGLLWRNVKFHCQWLNKKVMIIFVKKFHSFF